MSTPHLIQATDWKKHTAAIWVEQFGVWTRSNSIVTPGAYKCWLAEAIDKNDKSKKRTATVVVEPDLIISDDEARAVQHIILDMQSSPKAEIANMATIIILKFEHRWEPGALSCAYSCTERRIAKYEKQAFAEFQKRTGCL